MTAKAKFWNKIADKYSRQPIANQKAYEIKLDLTREYFTPESKVLEFGCGTGSTALLHAPYVEHIDATDVSPKMIEIARAKQVKEGIENIQFDVADMDSFNAPAETYDAVLGMNIIHLVDDRMKVMKQVHHVLKPGGVFVSSTMCLREKWYFRLMEPLFPLMHMLGQWPRVRRFTAARLKNDIESLGFQTVHHWQPGKGPVLFLVGRKPS